MSAAQSVSFARTAGMLAAAVVLGGCPDRERRDADTASAAAAEGARAHLEMTTGDDQLSTELQTYRLTMPRVEQFAQAVRNLQELTRTDPAVRARMEELGGEEDQTPGELANAIERDPQLRAAIERTGLSVREYMLVSLAFTQAAMAHRFQQEGLMQELPPGVPPENVAFIRENEERLRPLMEGSGEAP